VLARLKGWWRVLVRPSAYFGLGFLPMGGFIAGIVFWGGFNTALEATNTETFCISCHEMHDNVYQELRSTIHRNTIVRGVQSLVLIGRAGSAQRLRSLK
jgi:cytochrome c-type protein NapC